LLQVAVAVELAEAVVEAEAFSITHLFQFLLETTQLLLALAELVLQPLLVTASKMELMVVTLLDLV
jgi:hypothetical protein